MIVKKHRGVRQWLADLFGVSAHLDDAERERQKQERERAFWAGAQIGIVIGAERPPSMSLHQYSERVHEQLLPVLPLIRQMIAEQAREVGRLNFEQAMAARATNLAQEPPARATPPIAVAVKPTVKSVRQVAAARVPPTQIFPPDSLARMTGTNHVPAIAKGTTGVLFGMHLGKKKAEQKRAGG